MDRKRLSPIQYDIYNFMKDYCIGKENAIKGNKIANVFGMTNSQFRYHFKKIRSFEDFNVIFCAHPRYGYWIASDVSDVANDFLVRKAISEIYSAIANGVPKDVFYSALNVMKEKNVANLQQRFNLGGHEKTEVQKYKKVG